MGGIFSGRWGSHRAKTRVDRCRSFTVAALVGDKPPTAGHNAQFEWRDDKGVVVASIRFGFTSDRQAVLSYRWGEPGRSITLVLELVPLPTPRGGTRYLAVCPLKVNDVPCHRRAAKLYLPPGSPYFGCRHCHRLTYRSQQAHDPRVTQLLKSGKLAELAENSTDHSVQMIGLILLAIDEENTRFDRIMKRLRLKSKPRRRKKR